MDLQQITTERAGILADMERRRAELDAAVRSATSRLTYLDDAEKLIVFGLDVAKIEAGKQVITVQGRVLDHQRGRDGHGAGVRLGILSDAKLDLALGAPRMKKGYLGAKNYEGFGDQRSDHPYFYGPRHGSIVFRIGLTSEAIAAEALAPEQIEAGLFYLASLIKIEAALADKAAA